MWKPPQANSCKWVWLCSHSQKQEVAGFYQQCVNVGIEDLKNVSPQINLVTLQKKNNFLSYSQAVRWQSRRRRKSASFYTNPAWLGFGVPSSSDWLEGIWPKWPLSQQALGSGQEVSRHPIPPGVWPELSLLLLALCAMLLHLPCFLYPSPPMKLSLDTSTQSRPFLSSLPTLICASQSQRWSRI